MLMMRVLGKRMRLAQPYNAHTDDDVDVQQIKNTLTDQNFYVIYATKPQKKEVLKKECSGKSDK